MTDSETRSEIAHPPGRNDCGFDPYSPRKAGEPIPRPNTAQSEPKVTTKELRGMKGQTRISMVTAYDATFARLADEAGIDVLLVGDSVGMVVQGCENTLGVTMDEMIYHTRAVRRGARRAHVVADMPFMSYQLGARDALDNAGRLIKLGGAEAVKLEGGRHCFEAILAIVRAGIPVLGHVGLTPQSVHAMGGFKVQGRDLESARRILDDAKAIEQAGAYAVVLEGIPAELSTVITSTLSIPTIGIGAGPDCDGQVLVLYDLLGLGGDFRPKFVKRYAELGDAASRALRSYSHDVKSGAFPEESHSFRSTNLRAALRADRCADVCSDRGSDRSSETLAHDQGVADEERVAGE